jgi:predicted lipid-binding transport protein (Tim44 family)
MKKFWSLVSIALLTLGLAMVDAEAARLGGGRSIGQQRSSPAMRDAPKQSPNSAATAPAPNQAAGAPIPPRPSFMSRWGGMLAGLGLGALLGSMFGGGLGAGLGGLLSILLIGGAIFLLYRWFASRRQPEASHMRYAGVDNVELPRQPLNFGAGAAQPPQPAALSSAPLNVPPGFEVEPFIRQAKTAFLRLQAANDAKDLDDIRDYTTPEMYAELAMQIQERNDAQQKTEVVSLNAQLLEAVIEGDYAIASVRYSGRLREQVGANADAFDEVWHVRKNLKEPKATWLIAGIQQVA